MDWNHIQNIPLLCAPCLYEDQATLDNHLEEESLGIYYVI